MIAVSAVLNDPKAQSWFPVILFAISAGALGFAFHAQFSLGLEPCILCLYQRVPYAIIGLACAVCLIWRGPSLRRSVVFLCAVCFAVGGGIAAYHVGVEQHWWASAVCGGDLSGLTTTQDLLAGLTAPPEKSCDQIDWTLLGLSMATYNTVFSAAMAITCLIAFKQMKKAD